MKRLDHITIFFDNNTEHTFSATVLFTYYYETEKAHEKTTLVMIPARFAEPAEEEHLAEYIRLHMYGRYGKPEMLDVPVRVARDTFPTDPFRIRTYRIEWEDTNGITRHKDIEAVSEDEAMKEFYRGRNSWEVFKMAVQEVK